VSRKFEGTPRRGVVSVGTRCPQPDHQYDGGHGATAPSLAPLAPDHLRPPRGESRQVSGTLRTQTWGITSPNAGWSPTARAAPPNSTATTTPTTAEDHSRALRRRRPRGVPRTCRGLRGYWAPRIWGDRHGADRIPSPLPLLLEETNTAVDVRRCAVRYRLGRRAGASPVTDVASANRGGCRTKGTEPGASIGRGITTVRFAALSDRAWGGRRNGPNWACLSHRFSRGPIPRICATASARSGSASRQRCTSAHVFRGALKAGVLNTTLILRRRAWAHVRRVGLRYSISKIGLPAREKGAYSPQLRCSMHSSTITQSKYGASVLA